MMNFFECFDVYVELILEVGIQGAVFIDYMTEKCIPRTLVKVIPGTKVIDSDKFYYLADFNPPKDIPNAFFFNIDSVPNIIS